MAFGAEFRLKAATQEEIYLYSSPANKLRLVWNILLELQSEGHFVPGAKPQNLNVFKVKIDEGRRFKHPYKAEIPFELETYSGEVPNTYERALYVNPNASITQIALKAGELLFNYSLAKDAFKEGFTGEKALPGWQLESQSLSTQ